MPTIYDQLCLLERLHGLIRRKSTGAPEKLAARLHVSVRTLYRLLNEYKELGAPVIYCKTRESYTYSEEFDIDFSAFLRLKR